MPPANATRQQRSLRFAEANAHMQKKTIDSHIRNTKFRIELGKAHAEYITALSAKVSGKTLIEVAKSIKAPTITTSKKRGA